MTNREIVQLLSEARVWEVDTTIGIIGERIDQAAPRGDSGMLRQIVIEELQGVIKMLQDDAEAKADFYRFAKGRI